MMPSTCIQMQSQFCCMDTRCAFPCTSDVPMMCTCFPFCTICPKPKCCAQVKDIVTNLPENKSKDDKPSFDLSDVPVGELRVCEAMCCMISSFLFKYPACCGMKSEGLCLCFQVEQAMCKPVTDSSEAGVCCICFEGGQYCAVPSTCCGFSHQCCCMDQRCACPPTDKVPCVCTLLPGCTVCAGTPTAGFGAKVACCPKLGDIVPSVADVGKVQQE